MSIQIEETLINHEGILELNNSNQEKINMLEEMINIPPQSIRNLSFNIVNKVINSDKNRHSLGNYCD